MHSRTTGCGMQLGLEDQSLISSNRWVTVNQLPFILSLTMMALLLEPMQGYLVGRHSRLREYSLYPQDILTACTLVSRKSPNF